MKILVVGDLHGRRPVIRFRDFDCMVCVGDFCGSVEIERLYKKWFSYQKDNPDDDLDINEFFEFLGYGHKKMERLETKSLKAGRSIIKYFAGFDKPVFLVPGNWDQSYGESKIIDENKNDYNYLKFWLDRFNGDKINSKLIKGFRNVFDCQFKMRDFCGINFIGYGLSSASENPNESRRNSFNKKELGRLRVVYKKLVERLIGAYGNSKNKMPCVFISHNTPYNTRLDIVRDKNSFLYKKHLGSSVAREFILRRKPELCLCGHIHEGRGKCKLGKTLVVNPGYGESAQVLIDMDEISGRIRKVEFLER